MRQSAAGPKGRALALLLLGVLPGLPLAAQPAPPNPAPASQGYVLGPGDVIVVTVYGQEAFNTTTRIKPDGTIAMPLIGSVQAAGRTVLTLADEIRRQLETSGYLRKPIVNVEISEYRSQVVRVVGNVARPGIQPLDQDYRLLDVLLRAGWVRSTGDRTIYVRPAGSGEEIPISIDRLLRGDPQADIPVRPGMTIYVPEPELVYVMGPVMRPGGYPLMEGMTIGRLITMAGGAAPGGNRNRFTLERKGQKVKGAKADTVLEPGDVVTLRGGLF
ncbi:MAG: polysaccharide biosynthesis/export family protein [Sphingomonadaceae bacterium]|uniref:polysaccharide biosynthesis/export family protein n=1 Tax=Thermaurantiacus sp. TaxID=2820283 RepID=UPI00298F2C7B|nr:polysaccharide biosynthesis/export family protein [Thermaurantiacus sp.]MCS6986094.1 polysaccharide biosynthesis/export family protein [Sphingomonadaceae bacterium]MDW8414690.1 polysaccharide biosynthesis/export family protein [Thermaurantiacus sp.]